MRPQLRAFMPAEVGAAQPHAAQDVDLEEAPPVLVGDLLERLRLEDAEVVDQDVDVGKRSRQGRSTASAVAEVAGEALDLRARMQGGGMLAHGGVDVASDRPLTMTRAPSRGELAGDGEADALGRAGDESGLVVQFQVHRVAMIPNTARGGAHRTGSLPANAFRGRRPPPERLPRRGSAAEGPPAPPDFCGRLPTIEPCTPRSSMWSTGSALRFPVR